MKLMIPRWTVGRRPEYSVLLLRLRTFDPGDHGLIGDDLEAGLMPDAMTISSSRLRPRTPKKDQGSGSITLGAVPHPEYGVELSGTRR
jgi:hypothetical protein